MAIPASVLLYVNWVNGSGTYTAATPDKPDAHSWTYTNATIASEAGSPWNGQYVGKLTSWNSNITTTLTSSTMQATSGRIFVELNEVDPTVYAIARFHATTNANGEIQITKTSGNLRVSARWNSDGSSAYVDLGTYPTVPFAVEIIYDLNNGTANQRLRARTWNIGSSAGSMNNATSTAGSAATSDQFTGFNLAPAGEMGGLWLGRVAVSDDIAEDLSDLDESSGNTASPGAASVALTGTSPLANPQFSRPTADSTPGNWTASTGPSSDLYATLDEAVADTADYIQSPADPTNEAVTLKLATLTDPATDDGFQVQTVCGAVGSTGQVVVSLRQGNSPGTEIAAWTHTGLPVGSYQTFHDAVTSAQAGNITDFSDLYIRFVAS